LKKKYLQEISRNIEELNYALDIEDCKLEIRIQLIVKFNGLRLSD